MRIQISLSISTKSITSLTNKFIPQNNKVIIIEKNINVTIKEANEFFIFSFLLNN